MTARSDDPTSAETVERIGRLARLELEPARARELASDFENLLATFDSLRQVELDDGPCAAPPQGPAVPPAEEPPAEEPRPDEPRASLDAETLLHNAPRRDGDFFAVPPALGGDA